MADSIRDQVNAARRAGLSDADILDYLERERPELVDAAVREGGFPKDILARVAPPPTATETGARYLGVAGKAASPVALGAAGGAMLGAPFGLAAPGALIGSLAVPGADALTSAYNALLGQNVRLPSEAIRNMLPGPRPETFKERMVAAGAEGLIGPGSQIRAGQTMARTLAGRPQAIGEVISELPKTQYLAAGAGAPVAQGVSELTGSPGAGMLAGMATGGATGVRPKQRAQGKTAEDLAARAQENYDILDKSGFKLPREVFTEAADYLPTLLRAKEGYTPTQHPKVASAIEELRKDVPKDVVEIQSLRKVIGNAKASSSADERRVASALMDEFDNYILTTPEDKLIGGTPKAIEAWKEARADYAKMKKSEIFTDMIDKADFSNVSREQALSNALNKLARNDKQMRFFTKAEQEEIRKAARGSKPQDLMRVVAKFTPMTPAAAIFTAVSGPYGAGLAGAGLAAREVGSRMRARDVNRLAQFMIDQNRPPVVQQPWSNIPLMTMRGGLAGPYYEGPVNALVQE